MTDTTREPQASLYAALARAQARMPAVDKDAFNPHFKSRHMSIDHLIAQTRPVLNDESLAVVQLPIRGEDGMPMLRTMIVHADGGSIVTDAPLLPVKQDMQGLGAAITYMRRFAWAAACGIASETDDDGESIAQHTAGEPAGATQTGATGSVSATAPPRAQNGSQGFDREKAFKAAKAIERKLKTAGLPDETWDTNLVRDYGTAHTSELSDDQLQDLVAKLREAEKAIPS